MLPRPRSDAPGVDEANREREAEMSTSLIALHDPERDQRVIRTDDLFFSCIYDRSNRCLRITDFRTGNFPLKDKTVLSLADEFGAHKIYTLIERDDINGWHRVGYIREGSIPGYYKRSDAYLMSRLPGSDVVIFPESNDDTPERKAILNNDIKKRAKDIASLKNPGGRVQELDAASALETAEAEIKRLSTSKEGKKDTGLGHLELARQLIPGPVFQHFSRDGERIFILIQPKRSRSCNILALEYQDCFGNVKITFLRPPLNDAEIALSLYSVKKVLEELAEIGAVTAFAFTPEIWTDVNAIFLSCGFRKTGWLTHQRRSPDGYNDCILWTRRLA